MGTESRVKLLVVQSRLGKGKRHWPPRCPDRAILACFSGRWYKRATLATDTYDFAQVTTSFSSSLLLLSLELSDTEVYEP